MIRAHSDALLLVHVVWATIDRQPLLSHDDDAWLAGGVRSACARVGAVCVAVGNSDDHIHVVASVHPSTSVADLVQRMKGATSHAWNQHKTRPRLRWQTGYWARSVDPAQLAPLIDYVSDQRARHAKATVHRDWEQTTSE